MLAPVACGVDETTMSAPCPSVPLQEIGHGDACRITSRRAGWRTDCRTSPRTWRPAGWP